MEKIVVIGSRSEARLARARASIGDAVDAFPVDVCLDHSISTFFATVGPFDHLVITAANVVAGPFRDVTLDSARSFFDTKFWGLYRAVHAALPTLRADGSIILFSGAASQRGTPGLSVGSAINAAIEAFGRTLAVELAPMRVNTIAPGLIDTPVWDDMFDPDVKRTTLDALTAKLPLKRLGRPAEIAASVRYLIENTYTTGSVLFTDGGYLQTS